MNCGNVRNRSGSRENDMGIEGKSERARLFRGD